MLNYIKSGGFLLLISTVFIGLSCQPKQQNSQDHPDTDEQYEDAIPLIYHMSFMQRYSHKLYLSGTAENWELADIYSHEIEELSETIIEENHVDDGVNVSKLLNSMLLPQIENIEAAIDSKDKERFESNFQTMIQTCNQCHMAANYGAVKVTVPEGNPFNQDFSLPAGE
ncbi:hypothetical protein [Gracilimonas sp. BCB1]|uniref:hypothetical protein n=1 Tax=Gracilimonas sp. BCB1 TaxID=3152362 RepID=UPI0032D8C385